MPWQQCAQKIRPDIADNGENFANNSDDTLWIVKLTVFLQGDKHTDYPKPDDVKRTVEDAYGPW